jgi:hypothetical protein
LVQWSTQFPKTIQSRPTTVVQQTGANGLGIAQPIPSVLCCCNPANCSIEHDVTIKQSYPHAAMQFNQSSKVMGLHPADL